MIYVVSLVCRDKPHGNNQRITRLQSPKEVHLVKVVSGSVRDVKYPYKALAVER